MKKGSLLYFCPRLKPLMSGGLDLYCNNGSLAAGTGSGVNSCRSGAGNSGGGGCSQGASNSAQCFPGNTNQDVCLNNGQSNVTEVCSSGSSVGKCAAGGVGNS